MSWRRLGVLLQHLPAESALSCEVNGPRARWTQQHELLASIVDVLAIANWQRSSGKGRRPKRFPRPGDTGTRSLGTPVSIPEMRTILDEWSNN